MSDEQDRRIVKRLRQEGDHFAADAVELDIAQTKKIAALEARVAELEEELEAASRAAMTTAEMRAEQQARAEKLESELASLRSGGEISDERIAWFVVDEAMSPHVLAIDAIIPVVRRCLEIDRASRPAARWVRIQKWSASSPVEEQVLTEQGWVRCDGTLRKLGDNHWIVLMCPVPPPPEGEEMQGDSNDDSGEFMLPPSVAGGREGES